MVLLCLGRAEDGGWQLSASRQVGGKLDLYILHGVEVNESPRCQINCLLSCRLRCESVGSTVAREVEMPEACWLPFGAWRSEPIPKTTSPAIHLEQTSVLKQISELL